MTEHHRLCGSVVPFERRWHIIQEIDLTRLGADHRRLMQLCDDLEVMADALPAMPSAAEAQRLASELRELVQTDEAQERAYLAMMFARDRDDPLASALLRHVGTRHATDAARADELIATLAPDAGDAARVSPDALGYMLRCFFEGCRRAMDFEELVILTLGARRLTPEARAQLTDSLAARAA